MILSAHCRSGQLSRNPLCWLKTRLGTDGGFPYPIGDLGGWAERVQSEYTGRRIRECVG